jgi:penicillin-binding protein 1A
MLAAHRGLPPRQLHTLPAEPPSAMAEGAGALVDEAARAGGQVVRGIGEAIDDLLKGIFGR